MPHVQSEVLTFGKHRGKTFEVVLAEEPSYASFVRRTVESAGSTNEQMLRFAAYLNAQDGLDPCGAPSPFEVLTFGKYKGRSFEAVTAEDPSYTGYVRRTAVEEGCSNQQMKRFAQFLKILDAQQTSASSQGDPQPPLYASEPSSWRLTMGKHKGKTISEVYDEDKSYCKWAVKQWRDGASYGLITHLAEYAEAQDAAQAAAPAQTGCASAAASTTTSSAHREVSFGKHKGKTYQSVYSEDAPYCDWILMTAAQQNPYPELVDFADFVKMKKSDGILSAASGNDDAADAAPQGNDEWKLVESFHCQDG
eukprot:6463640-Amphidinium_carterae.1